MTRERRTAGRYRLVLSNTYGHPNVGDEAILASMIRELTRRIEDVEISVLTLRPDLTKQNHPGVHVVKSGVVDGIRPTIQVLKRADLLVVGGGGIIQDQTSLSNLLFHLSRPSMAHLLGTPFMCYAVGVGPLKAGIGRWLVSAVLGRAKTITVRDQLSAELLYRIGLPPDEVHVTGDPAMVLDFPEKPHAAPIYQQIAAAKQLGKRLIGFSLRPVAVKYTLAPHRPGQASSSAWFLEGIAGLAKQVMDRLDAHVVFFSMHPEQDDFLGSQFADRIGAPDRLTLVPGNLSPQTMMAAIGLTDLFIGMRLHSLIFAARSSVPLIALAYDRKVEGFMQLLDQENRSLPPDQWAPDRLLQLVSETWHQRAAIGGKIAARLPALQVDARRNVDILMKCLPESASHLSGDIG